MALVGSLSGSFGLVGVSGTMEPAVNNAYSLGTSSKKWGTVFATALTGSLTTLADGRSFLVGGSNVTITSASDGQITIASTGGGGGSGDNAAQYLVLAATASLDNERVFTAGTGISVTDGGAGGNFTVGVNNSVVATLTGSAFSGPITGTTLSMTGNVTGSNFLVSGDEITATAPVRINLGNTAATVNIGQSGTGNALNVKGNLDVDGTADIAGAITLSGNGQSVTHSGTGNLTIASTSGNVVIESTTFNGNDVTIPGNLTVNGSVVSIASDNLKVKDSVLLLGSGSIASNAKAAIAFVSGSATTDRAVIFGTIGGGDVSAVASMDVQDGSIAGSSLVFTNLTPMRASSFQVGSGATYLSSSDGTSFVLSGTSGVSKIGGTLGKGISFEADNAQLALLKDTGSDTLFGSDGPSAGRGLILSGTTLTADYGNGVNGIQFARAAQIFGRITNPSAGSLLLSTTAPNNNLTVGTSGTGISTVSGSTVALNYASMIQLQRHGVEAVKIDGPQASVQRLVAAQTDASFTVGTVGGTSDNLIMSASNIVLKHRDFNGSHGVDIQKDSNTYISFRSNLSQTTLQGGQNQPVVLAGKLGFNVAMSGSVAILSGSTSIDFITGSVPGRAAFFGLSSGLPGLHPAQDSTYNLGSPALRWANIYTGDLHLRNDRGNWTIIEEADYLTITNNLNGKRYKFVMEEL